MSGLSGDHKLVVQGGSCRRVSRGIENGSDFACSAGSLDHSVDWEIKDLFQWFVEFCSGNNLYVSLVEVLINDLAVPRTDSCFARNVPAIRTA